VPLEPSNGRASTGIPAIDQFADVLVLNEFAPIGRGKTLFHFREKPLVVTEHSLHGLDNESFPLASLLGSDTRQLFFQFWTQAHFHAASLGGAKGRVNNALLPSSPYSANQDLAA
jgi:hypothetical protein